jgi:multisubunit Na+/H+ antiporter MnhF subunit
MIETSLTVGSILLALAVLLALVRIARGPGVLNRVLAFDLVATAVVGLIVLLSLRWRSVFYLELILIFTMLGFLSSVAFVLYLHRTIRRRDDRADETSEPL